MSMSSKMDFVLISPVGDVSTKKAGEDPGALALPAVTLQAVAEGEQFVALEAFVATI